MNSLFYGTGDDNAPNPSYSGQAQQQPATSSVFGGFSSQPAKSQPAVAGIGGMGQAPSVGGFGDVISGAEEVGMHVTTSKSVKEYAYTEEKNRQFRPQMEDTYCIQDVVAGDQSCGFFGVFVGHGGKQVSEHCSEMFPVELRKEI